MTEHPLHTELKEFAAGMLTGERADQLRRHLESCADCRHEVTFERQLTRSLEELPLDHPSPQFDGRVLSDLQQSAATTQSSLPGWLRPAAAGLLITATMLVIIFAGGSGERQSESILSPAFEQITAVLAPVTELLHSQFEHLTPSFDASDNQTIRIFLIASLALLLIGSLDRLLLPILRQRGRTG